MESVDLFKGYVLTSDKGDAATYYHEALTRAAQTLSQAGSLCRSTGCIDLTMAGNILQIFDKYKLRLLFSLERVASLVTKRLGD